MGDYYHDGNPFSVVDDAATLSDGGMMQSRELEDSGLEFEDLSGTPMHEVILTSLKVYGSVFAALFVVFLLGRQYYPKAYLILRDSDEATELSKRTFGPISWMWKVFGVSDEEIFEECGMDAIVFIRTLRFGMRVAVVSALNGLYLFPVYATAGGDMTQLESVTLGNVPQSDPALLSATVACYVVYTFALYLLYREFAWFTAHRHKVFTYQRPDNYTVYVKFIPQHLRSNEALLDYFRSIFGHEAVLDAQIAYDIPSLDKACADRDALCGTDEKIGKLEHAINVLDVKGTRPRHKKIIVPDVTKTVSTVSNPKKGCCSGGCSCRPPAETVDSIDEYTKELDALNEKVATLIDNIDERTKGDSEAFRDDLEAAIRKNRTLNGDDDSVVSGASMQFGTMPQDRPQDRPTEEVINIFTDQPESAPANEEESTVVVKESSKFASSSFFSSTPKKSKSKKSNDAALPDEKKPSSFSTLLPVSASFGNVGDAAKGSIGGAAKLVSGTAQTFGTGALSVGTGALSLLTGKQDGTPRDAGFVSFTSLKAKQSAQQMLHHPKPFCLDVLEAPLPDHLFWGNVGMKHKTQQIGRVVAAALTITLCLFWTIIVSFIVGLSEVENLTKMFPFLEDWLEAAPWLSMFLNQLKPLLLVLIVGFLPPILIAFSKREGHIAETSLQTSMFFKLAVFLIIQIFFVQMLSGSIISEIQNFIEDPMSIVTLLAEALPQQAQSFMQYVIVQTALNLGLELMRGVDILKAWVRGCIGPNLTEAERAKPWFSLEPLSVVPEMEFADQQGTLILYYMILFCYSVMSPFTSIVMWCAFGLFSLGYRHHLFYLYGKANDSGGQLFDDFVSLSIACIIISEIVMFGVLGLKGGVVSAPLLIPLIVGTFMFKAYINQQHYKITKDLPSTIAVEEDIRNIGKIDWDFVKGVYRQPAFEHRHKEPENMSSVREERQDAEESQAFMTPDNSEAEIVVDAQ